VTPGADVVLPTAVRVWAHPVGWSPSVAPPRPHRPARIVVFDTETYTDNPRQPLLVGAYSYARVTWARTPDGG
jgi:hypothetical protein